MTQVKNTYSRVRMLIRAVGSIAVLTTGFLVLLLFSSSRGFPQKLRIGSLFGTGIAYAEVPLDPMTQWISPTDSCGCGCSCGCGSSAK